MQHRHVVTQEKRDGLECHPPPPYFGSLKFPRVRESLRSSTDSDLEAFNHNPTDGSFAPLSFQASA